MTEITALLIQKLESQYPGVDVISAANRIILSGTAKNPAALLTHEIKTAYGMQQLKQVLRERTETLPTCGAQGLNSNTSSPSKVEKLTISCTTPHDTNCVCESCWQKLDPRLVLPTVSKD